MKRLDSELPNWTEWQGIAVIDGIAIIVREACAQDTNVFGYGIWTHHITQVVKNGKRLAESFVELLQEHKDIFVEMMKALGLTSRQDRLADCLERAK